MYFLCPQHRQKMLCLSESEMSAYWLDWMWNAAQYYESGTWEEGIPFAGCALDLTASALCRKDLDRVNLSTLVTLSAIYTTNMLTHRQEFEKAQQILESVSQRLIVMMFNTQHHAWAETCLAVIANPERQLEFFDEYLDFPIVLPEGESRSQLRLIH